MHYFYGEMHYFYGWNALFLWWNALFLWCYSQGDFDQIYGINTTNNKGLFTLNAPLLYDGANTIKAVYFND